MKMYARGSEVRQARRRLAEIKIKKADLDNSGKLSSYEIERGKKIEKAMATRR